MEDRRIWLPALIRRWKRAKRGQRSLC